MKLHQEKLGAVTVTKPCGPLTDEECDGFMEAIFEQLESANPRIVLDMSEIPYLDSCGLEALLSATRELRSRSMCFKIAALTPTCREILDLTELVEEFEIFDGVQDAVRSFI